MATLRLGRPATSESCFCAAARAPVSLTLDPASYLSNSKRNSAAAEGKKITSAAELGGKRPSLASTGPTPAPCTPNPCTQPSLEPWMEPRLSQELGASLCSQRCVCVWGCLEGLGPPPCPRLLAGWGPPWFLSGKVTCLQDTWALTMTSAYHPALTLLGEAPGELSLACSGTLPFPSSPQKPAANAGTGSRPLKGQGQSPVRPVGCRG